MLETDIDLMIVTAVGDIFTESEEFILTGWNWIAYHRSAFL